MPKTVAVVGASNDRNKFGNKALRAFQAEGHTVIPINPHEAAVEGLKAYALGARRAGTDRHGDGVCAAGNRASRLLAEFERKQIPEIWINPGAESDELMAEAARRGLNVIYACSIVAIGRSPAQFP